MYKQAALTPIYLTHRASVQCRTLRSLLITLYSHDANTPPQNGSQLGVAELVNGAVVVDRCVDETSWPIRAFSYFRLRNGKKPFWLLTRRPRIRLSTISAGRNRG